MKILFIVTRCLLGGHVLSAFTTARSMKKNGHDVVFAGGAGKLVDSIKNEMPYFNVSIPEMHGTRESNFTWKSFSAVQQLKSIVEKEKIQMIHAFDERAYIHIHIVGLVTGTPVICTLCGGVAPYTNIPISRKIIVFSEEQKKKMHNVYRWPIGNVDVIRNRIDVKQIFHGKIESIKEVLPDVEIKLGVPKIMMISSFDGTKIESIFKVIETVSLLLDRGIKIQMIFIGGRPELLKPVIVRADAVNEKFGGKYVILTGRIINAYRLLSCADIVLGVGRSAFEGMAYSKPTLVVGQNGFAGLVSKEAVGDLGYYNFSGRNQKSSNSPSKLAEVIEKILKDKKIQLKLGTFANKFVTEEIDVEKGISKIEKLYEVNMEKKNRRTKLLEIFSAIMVLVSIWMDNFYHTFGMPIKKCIKKIKYTFQ